MLQQLIDFGIGYIIGAILGAVIIAIMTYFYNR